MAGLDRLLPSTRDWDASAQRYAKLVLNAARAELRPHHLADPIEGATLLASLYHMAEKPRRWQDHGDVATHLLVAWPPDLGYVILYALREISPPLPHDPIPLVLKAVEMTRHLRCEHIALHAEPTERLNTLRSDPTARAKAGAQLLVRELSVVPLRYATGIYRGFDAAIKPFVNDALANFNPRGARVLLKPSRLWVLTPSGFLKIVGRGLTRILFGRHGD